MTMMHRIRRVYNYGAPRRNRDTNFDRSPKSTVTPLKIIDGHLQVFDIAPAKVCQEIQARYDQLPLMMLAVDLAAQIPQQDPDHRGWR